MSRNSCNLRLHFSGPVNPDFRNCTFEVEAFDGKSGMLSGLSGNLPAPALGDRTECEIRTAETGKLVWKGFIRFEPPTAGGQLRFFLQIRSRQGSFLDWSALPEFFSIADGGYEALFDEQVGRLLDDLLQFQEVTRSLFFSGGGGVGSRIPTPCASKMEDIVSTDAIILQFQKDLPSPERHLAAPSVVAIELFEVTYILVGFVEEILEEERAHLAVFTLTGHIYRDKRSAGRRFLNPPVVTPQGEILEVSDFGARIRRRLEKVPVPAREMIEDAVEIGLEGFGCCRFKVVHRSQSLEGFEEIGCMIQSDPQSAGNWMCFLLSQQYPLLKHRKKADHAPFWKLLSDTGYTAGESELNRMIQGEVEREWSLVDETCPANGATVVAMDGDTMVGTIGVTRVSGSAWNTQLLASSKDPAHIPQTRSLMSWRTRHILQQDAGEFNIAFFSRDKAFLDRFFRKFYIQEREAHPEDLTWEEWRLVTHVLAAPERSVSKAFPRAPADLSPSALFDVINGSGDHPAAPGRFLEGGCAFLKGRPFQHLCQYFSSAWLAGATDAQAMKAIVSTLGDHQVFTIRTKEDLPLEAISPSGRNLDDGWDVIWICHRRLLPKFLSNSLRAVELMHRKYGPGRAA